ncbi:MAG: HAMP domain-containing sensor histidine kinase [Eubacteriales bacterium]|nr:HAMP domain-containing sensor histidine kinase [Eubacteriales bacterium]
MKRLSIRLRVTLWFTALMSLLAILVLIFLYLAGQYSVQTSMQNQLVNTITSSLDEIEYDDGAIEPDDDLDYFIGGVYLSIYDAEGRLLYGRIPSAYNGVLPFRDQTLQKFSEKGLVWSIYDVKYDVSGYGTVWVRGILSSEGASSAFSTLFRLACISLPVLVLLAALGGYCLICRAFRPVRHIIESAEQIGSGNDLSLRIGLEEGNDEIYHLAETFDRMFDRLEDSFSRERQFTSDASHELRTPLAVILSQCDYSLSGRQTETEYIQALETIQTQAGKMSALIAQLLTLARADRGQDKILRETLNLSNLAEMVVLQMEESAQEKNITIHTDLVPDLTIQGDETMLMRLLLNLMENGIKYGREGGNLWVSLDRRDDTIYGTVRDDGIGISSEHLPKIWDRFYQADLSRSSTRDGVGLGLSMVKYIVQAHGGTITAESTPGVGSVFRFDLPVL